MSRLDPPSYNEMSPAQRQVHDDITSGPRGAVQGPLGIWLWRATLADRAQTLGQYCRYNTSLPARLSELAILITAKHWNAEFEWQHHKPLALEAGLDSTIVENIRQGNSPAFAVDDERLVYDFASELLNTRVISDPTYQAAIDLLGKDSVIDLVGVLGYYALISMTINVFQIDAPNRNELD